MRKDIKEALMRLYEELHKRRATILTLSAIVVFVTTYLLILPAMTLEKDKAAKSGGIDVPSAEMSAEDESTLADETTDASDDVSSERDSEDNRAAESGRSDTAGKKTGGNSETEGSDNNKDANAGQSDQAVKESEEESSTEDIEKTEIKQKVISDGGKTYEVSVTFDEDSGIPDDAELRVTRIKKNDDAYADVQKKVGKEFGDELSAIPSDPLLLDISIWADGKEIEPAEGSSVKVEARVDKDHISGIYTSDNSPILINDKPIDAEEQKKLEQNLQVVHDEKNGDINVVKVENDATSKEHIGTFETESFSNWLLYLDEDLTDINITTGDSLTLRPYSEWIWKQGDEPADYQGGQWIFPAADWNSRTEGSYTYYTHKTNGSVFRSYSKTDSQLNETYTVITSESISSAGGGFDLQTNKGKTIHVHVTDGQSSGKPGTVDGISGLTVNLFDYDVPGTGNQYDFTKSGDLDVQSNVASNPDNNNNINTYHDLKFLGYGGSNVGENDTWFWINNYTKDVPQQGIVKDHLFNGYPELGPGKNGQERGNPGLGYLFDPSSKNHNVYAFPNADGLFQRDNQGYYYYNSNSNYAEYDQNSNSFILYEHTYSQNTGGSNGANAKPIGFFPFHEYDTVDTQPEMNFNQNLNHHFGMSMTVDFEIPKGKRIEGDNGYMHDIIYEFSGDDDLWVFVDDELVLDIGGIHQPVTGTINFTTGEIKVHGVNNITKTFDVGGHTLKMFYIERGGCDSNLSVRFNLPLTKGRGTVKIAKKSLKTDTTESDKFLEGAVFGVWDNPNCNGEPYMVATSGEDGIVTLNDLPVKDENQKYYLRELVPPDGYMLNSTVFTLQASGKNADGDYIFVVKDGDSEIEKMEQSPNYPVIRDDRPTPIDLTVEKKWQDADGTELADTDKTATFELKRYKTPVKVSYSAECLVKVYRVGRNGGNDWTYPLSEEYEHSFAGGSVLSVNWTYNQYLGSDWKTWYYRVDNGQVRQKPVTGPAEITLPSSGAVNVYIYDGNLGTQYQQYGVENINVTGTEGSSHSEVDIGDRVIDDSFSQTVTLPTQAGAWTDTFSNLPVQETHGDTTHFYEYFIVEKNVPDGFEAVYLDGEGNPIANPASQATTSTETKTIVNRKLLDVPVEKHWPDYSGDEYTWTAEFVLEQREVKVNEGDPDAPDAVTDFAPVEGREHMTVSKDQTHVPTFDSLPMYRVHSNGTLYRIEYSVEEVAYEVRRGSDVVASWTKGSDATGDWYTPQFVQDAGEHGATVNDYKIIVINTLAQLSATKEIDIDIHKTWPEGTDFASSDNTYARFVLKRKVHEEYRDYSKVTPNTEWVTVTMNTDTAEQGESSRHQTLTVPKDTELYIVGAIHANTNANKVVFMDGGHSIELVRDNSQNPNPSPFDIKVTADRNKTIVLNQGDNYVVGGRDGFRLSDTYGNKNEESLDERFEEHFTLNKADGWEKLFKYLSAIEENSVDPKTGQQTIYVYSYYFEEIECNPADFAPVFKDSIGRILGNADNPIDFSTEVTAENKPSLTDVVLKKVEAEDVEAEHPKTLKGAAFRIEKYTAADYRAKDTSWGTNGEMSMSDDDTGLFAFSGLSAGYYKIVETEYPDGHSKLEADPKFKIELDTASGKLKAVLLNDDGTPASGSKVGLVRVDNTGTITLIVGNEPGVELPKSGGMGTTWLYIMGALLAVVSGILLAGRRWAGVK